MHIFRVSLTTLFLLSTPLLAACSDPQQATINADSATNLVPQQATIIADTVTNLAPQQAVELTVYKDKNCGCCKNWIAHINESGINTNVIDVDNMSQIKSQHQIKPNQRSCHTAVSSDGFVFEGHVPAKFIKQFLSEKHPSHVQGLTVPAMPVGTPGMEVDDRFQSYQIEQLTTQSQSDVYQHVNHYDEQF